MNTAARHATTGSNRTIGRFVVERELGKGAQGSVFLATDPHLGRKVAIKSVRAHASAETIERLHQEARVVIQFSHPNIVTLYDALEHEGAHYLVLEYVDGETLQLLLRRERKLEPGRAARIAMQIADALAYAHAKQVIHRDVKPANVMIAAGDTARIMDFGIAVSIGEAETVEALQGTPLYMSPERLLHSQVNEGADVFSLGMVLYEMLAGRTAVTGSSIFEVMHKIANEPFEPPSRFAPGVDERLDHLVLRAISKKPEERQASAAALKAALAEFLAPAEPRGEGGGQVAQAAVEFLMRRMRHKSDFPALSRTIGTINRIAADSDESVQALSSALLKDFALTNKLLRLVNSTAYGQFGGNISTISRAVMILGFNTVRSLAVTLILFEHMQNQSQAAQLKDEVIASYFTGIMAHRVAARSGATGSEEGFICGVLHHLGRMLATYYFYDEYTQIQRRMQGGESEDRAARAVLGVSFEELCVGVARHWHLPGSIVQSLENIGESEVVKPSGAGDRLKLVANFATALCRVAADTPPERKDAELERLKRQYEAGIALPKRLFSTLVDDSIKQFLAEAGTFVGDAQKSRVLQSITQWSAKKADGPDGAAPIQAIRGAATETAGADTLDQAITQTTRIAAAAPEPGPGAAARRGETSNATLSAGIQDITNALIGDYNLNDVLRIILETMYRGMGFSQVLLATRDPRQARLVGRFGFGARIEELLKNFNVPLAATPDVFQVALDKNADLYIADARAPNIAERLPEWYKKAANAPSFLLLPVVINKRVVGLFYADCDQPGQLTIEAEQLRLLKTLRNQAVLAVRQKN